MRRATAVSAVLALVAFGAVASLVAPASGQSQPATPAGPTPSKVASIVEQYVAAQLAPSPPGSLLATPGPAANPLLRSDARGRVELTFHA